VRRGRLAAIAILAMAVAVETLDHGHHGGALWHRLPGFHFAFGLLGCYAIVVVSKALGRLGIQQPATDEDEP